MQFIIIGLDGTDEEAPARRQAVRPDHIKRGKELREAGNLRYAAALLHDDGTMKGSMYVVNFETETALQAYLETEPYVLGDVWQTITIHKSNTAEPWQFNRSQEWYEKNEQ